MTICIGAICGYGDESVILGIADQKLTLGNIGFEPERGDVHSNCKIWMLPQTSALLFGGDMGVQAEIKCDMHTELNGKFNGRVPPVRDLADWYARTMKATKKRKNNEPLAMAAIIAGIDASGAHLYTVSDEWVNQHPICNDGDGFTCIGSGEGVARAEIMRHAHDRRVHYQEAIINLHQAKKRAEAAGDVGTKTDMFLITKLGIIPFPVEFVRRLDEMHGKRSEKERSLMLMDKIEVVLEMSKFFKS